MPHDEIVDPAHVNVRSNVRRDFRDQTRFRRTAIDQTIDQAVSAEILDAGDAEWKIDVVAIRLYLLRQECFRPESDPDLAVLDQVIGGDPMKVAAKISAGEP